MKCKKIISGVIGVMVMTQGISAFAYGEESTQFLREKQLEFASRYEYKEGDSDKSFQLYPEINYTSGIEYGKDGKVYECPAIYIDDHAKMVDNYSLKKGQTKLVINGKESKYFNECVTYNSRLLVPADAFSELGLTVKTDTDTYVTTISNEDIVLEILPNLIGMRKNQNDGFYVPLEVCARIVDGVLYVPVRAIADEFGLEVEWIEESNMVTLNKL